MTAIGPRLDALIVGAGPAGLSAAAWLGQLGLRCAVLERANAPAATLAGLSWPQDSVLGQPKAKLADIGRALAAHAAALPGVALHVGAPLQTVRCRRDGGWQVDAGGERFEARCLVLATGLKPRRPAAYFAQPGLAGRVLDAVSLTLQRDRLAPGSTLLLGGGDNAVENGLHLAARGHRVTLWTRSGWRAQPALLQRLKQAAGIRLREGEPVPTAVGTAPDGGLVVRSAAHGEEAFDHVAVLFGYEPVAEAHALARQALRDVGQPAPAEDVSRELAEAPSAGLFVAGDASGRWHPCVQTALADGVAVAKRVQALVARGVAPPAQQHGARSQVLHLTGLRLDARLGWLDREKRGPQPIEVDAHLNMGQQPLLPDDDDLSHVLDYRKVRQIIIDECNAEHTHLIETLLGKLCQRLAHLPGVLGVRVKVTKLEIFDDCQVAMQAEHGAW